MTIRHQSGKGLAHGAPAFENELKHAFTLVAVRHGRTALNAAGRFQGHTDIPLDDEGRSQARQLARSLATERFDRAVASDLVRARETAEIILGGRPPALETDPRWREMRFGMWEGLTWPEIVERDPALANAPATPKFATPAGGESFDEVCARVADAVDALDSGARDGANILIATHAGVLHALLRVVVGENEATALGVRFSPGGVTRFAVGPTGGRVVNLNVAPVPEATS